MAETRLHRVTAIVNGVNIFYRDTGSEHPAMLCLHGRWGRGETWTELMSRYQDRFRVIAPDQRGHGLSDQPPSGYAGKDLAQDAHQLLKQLNCGPAIVVGHSMGSRVGAHLAERYPDRVKALVIIDNTAYGPENMADIAPESPVPGDEFTRALPEFFPTYHDVVQFITNRFGAATAPYFLESLIETDKGYDFMFSRAALKEIDRCDRSWLDILPKIDCPVLLVRASDSQYLSDDMAREMESRIKSCTYAVIQKSRHWVYLDNPREFYPEFEKFIRGLEDGNIR